ncbi:MAG: chromosome segregation protein SMC, partial [Rubrivivax sp.]
GESRASELRGESMQDVIFNGTNTRKPASRSSVELVFDNADHRAGGQWGQFAEIAVKRVLTRDGTSSYYINNQPVRRRDVQDVFLGTGLGPRAYAIIGQGTISRIIESKPEDLRLFLEEAAGVSKYKERRRETENRLTDTRENLTRVEDILRELNSNLDKLEKQAEVAQQYNLWQSQATLKQHQLWFLKHRDAAGEEQRAHQAMLDASNALEGRIAELRRVETELESQRQSHFAAGDLLHQRQGELAEAALEVSRLEERIRYVVEGRERAQGRLRDLHAQSDQWAARQAEAHAELSSNADAIAAAEAAQTEAVAEVDAQAKLMPDLEQTLSAARQAGNAQRGAVAQVQQQIQVLAAESRSLGDQARQLEQRAERLGNERKGLASPDAARIEAVRLQADTATQTHTSTEEDAAQLTQRVQRLDEERRALAAVAAQEGARKGDLSARLEALRALQDKVQSSGKLKPWLLRQGLEGLQGLWQRVHIDAGWETALEAALRERLNALAVSRLDTVRAFAADAPPARLAFYSQPDGAIDNSHRTLPRLSDLLRLNDAGLQALLNDWLEGVYTAASLDDALAARGKLTHGEVIMSREGHAVSQYAVSFYAPDSEQAGMLARQQEIENLDRQWRAQSLIADEAKAASVRAEAAHAAAEGAAAQARRAAADAQTRAHQMQVELLRLTQQAEASQARGQQLDTELAEAQATLAGLHTRRSEGEARFEALDAALADAQQRHSELDDAVMAAEATLTAARESQRQLERRAQEAQFQQRALATRRDEVQRGIGTAEQQLLDNRKASEQIETELAGLSDAAEQAGLQSAVGLRVQRENALAAARTDYDALSASLRTSDEQRLVIERGLEPMRDALTKLQLAEQAAMLGGAQFLEQLVAAEVDLPALGEGIEQGGVKLWGLQGEVERLNREVTALGAVNLAALNELTAGQERKAFLDAQNADLQEAMSTLEDAIHKIDLETRDLLGQTFTQVNEHFGRMFPSLFGGGNAKLVMTGDEILDSGVQVMAQPPGKKNSTIHLMSGGEKALTAIALVFAIFQLNPAPFCLLDEVDAPLDEANVGRFTSLVTEMSDRVQFVFVSHNKAT